MGEVTPDGDGAATEALLLLLMFVVPEEELAELPLLQAVNIRWIKNQSAIYLG